jgi:DNA-binding CsgD family transcriptional regulator
MAAATSGEVDLLETVAETCCSLVQACELAGDAGRLEQWARIVDAFVSRRGDVELLSFCQTCNAELLGARGRREEAESAFRASAADLRTAGHRSRCVDPAVRLAEIRVLQGRFEEAGALLDGRRELPEAVLVAADLDLARGETSLAAARLLRRINVLGRDNLLATSLLGRLVEVQLAAGDLDAAAATTAELAEAADGSGHPLMRSHAELAAGLVALARGEDAAAELEAARDRFSKLGNGLDAARATFVLARTGSDPVVAREHAAAALAAFEALGATHLADEAAALLRELGGPARTGPKEIGTLTAREVEVLRLLGEGLTNAEIAARLFISVKTAGHHVSNVLAKLHLRNRQEAAAYALRTFGTDPLGDHARRETQG